MALSEKVHLGSDITHQFLKNEFSQHFTVKLIATLGSPEEKRQTQILIAGEKDGFNAHLLWEKVRKKDLWRKSPKSQFEFSFELLHPSPHFIMNSNLMYAVLDIPMGQQLSKEGLKTNVLQYIGVLGNIKAESSQANIEPTSKKPSNVRDALRHIESFERPVSINFIEDTDLCSNSNLGILDQHRSHSGTNPQENEPFTDTPSGEKKDQQQNNGVKEEAPTNFVSMILSYITNSFSWFYKKDEL